MIYKASRAPRAVVLIVEDGPLLLQLAAEVVDHAGFVALEAGDAGEAFAILETRSDIAVLFTDVNMPGSMDGLELAHAVRDRWPSIKIVVASGHVRLQQSDLPSDSVFLPKPYRGAALAAQLHSLLVRADFNPVLVQRAVLLRLRVEDKL
jgi:two-component system, response regulator PdtaR